MGKTTVYTTQNTILLDNLMKFYTKNNNIDKILPIIWFFATFFSVLMYNSTVMGTPWIFKIIKGKISNNNGNIKLKMGENKWMHDSSWRNKEDWFRCLIIDQSI